MNHHFAALLIIALAGPLAVAGAADFVNSVGQTMIYIEPGTFLMGSRQGDRDEEPLHRVAISRGFHLAATEVTNREYEAFDPAHRALRGKQGFSSADGEAVIFVSWEDAVAFCEWLTKKEGRPYRLPTEAEWEYAARSGTTTEFNTGDTFPKAQQNNQTLSWYPDPQRSQGELERVRPLLVGRHPANAWGLHDMHGNVEEWCADWYGRYAAGAQTDPVGRADGEFRVTRGGSHSVAVKYLRSANRAGTIPQDRSWIIGFRPAMGPPPQTVPLPVEGAELDRQAVRQDTQAQDPTPATVSRPFFRGPRRYVHVTPTPRGPFFEHNHVPSLAQMPNGDLLAIWFTGPGETPRDLHYVASRLRLGQNEWEPASESFFTPPDRNATASMLWWDGASTVWHFGNIQVAAAWTSPALIARTSDDSGATWSRSRILDAEHGPRKMVVASALRTRSGAIVFSADVPGRQTPGNGGTAIWVSTDNGATFRDPGEGKPDPEFTPGQSGAWIAGIHAPIAETKDRRGLIAFGRRDRVDEKLLRSVSHDLGETWKYSRSELDPLGPGQRLTLLRLQDGSLFVATFTQGMELVDIAGQRRVVKGLYAALSYDDGVTWPHKRLITDDGPPRELDGGGWTKVFTMSTDTAEPKGYLTSIQARDGTIHLISSALHYEFNAAWIRGTAAATNSVRP